MAPRRSAPRPTAGDDRPLARLAVPYNADAPDPMALAEAAAGLCRLTWLIDGRDPGLDTLARLLAKLGDVVDLADRTAPAAAEVVASARPDGVVAFADRSIPLAAAVAERLGLAGPRPAAAELLVDKLAQRRALAAGGLAVPGCWPLRLDDPGGLDSLPSSARFPVVVKPRRGSGSKLTFSAPHRDELAAALEIERRVALAGRAPDDPELIVEERLADGLDTGTAFADYCSVELAADAAQVGCLALTGRFALAEPFRETGLFVPSDLAAGQATAVARLAAAAVRALGAPTGCYHVEIKLTPSGPRVIEVNGRIGGTVPDLLRLSTDGFSIFRVAMRLALGEALPEAAGDRLGGAGFERVAFRHLLQPPVWATAVEEIDGLDELRAVPGVVEVVTHRPPGSPLDWRDGTEEYVVKVTGIAGDHAEMAARATAVERAAHISYAGIADLTGHRLGAPGPG